VRTWCGARLRNHAVAAPVCREEVHVAGAQQGRELGGQLAHVDAEVRGLGAIDVDRDLQAVELEVGVDKGELAARPRRLEQLLRNLVDRARLLVGTDHHLDRLAAAGAWQRRRRENRDLQAGDTR
jgi:hypothetical protein